MWTLAFIALLDGSPVSVVIPNLTKQNCLEASQNLISDFSKKNVVSGRGGVTQLKTGDFVVSSTCYPNGR